MFKCVALSAVFASSVLAVSPHWFELNLGQTNQAVEFLGPSVYLGDSKLAIRANHQTVVMTLAGANHTGRGQAFDQLAGISNWYLGNDPTKWRSGIRHYARVVYRDVYPGIDQVFYYNAFDQLEFDFIVAPGADPSAIQLSYNFPVRTDPEGNLLIADVRLERPKVYQNGRELAQSYLTQPATLSFTVVNPQSAPSSPITLIVGVPAPQFTAASVVNAASYAGGAVAPGEIVTIFGSNFGTMANTQVLLGSDAAVVVFVNSTQVSATVPYSVAGVKQISLTVSSNGLASAPATLAVAPSSPAIFSADSNGKGQASAENADYTINGPSHPAAPGSFVAQYGTGGGPLTIDTPPRLMLPVSAIVGGLPAQVFYAGIAPGLIEGVMQINVAIPSAVAPGPSVPVIVTVGHAISNTVTIAINQ